MTLTPPQFELCHCVDTGLCCPSFTSMNHSLRGGRGTNDGRSKRRDTSRVEEMKLKVNDGINIFLSRFQ